jgi:energy-coupling factor transporter ATP-binding protein EcfA2
VATWDELVSYVRVRYEIMRQEEGELWFDLPTTGERHQRVAVRLVTGDRRPPLVFDDPFVTLDDDRATRALDLLRAVAADFQVIYLTTSDRYDSAADSVVELPGPTALDDGPPPVETVPADGTRREAAT